MARSSTPVRIPALLLGGGMLVWLFVAAGSGGPATASRPAAAPASAPAKKDLAAECRASADKLLARMDGSFRAVIRPPFVVIGNLPAARLRQIAAGSVVRPAETMWRSYFKVKPDKVITALLFKDDKTYRHWAKQLFNDTDLPHFGYCRSTDRIMVMNIATGTGTLVHELTHALIVYDFPGVPTWFNEGLASLHEQCYVRPDRIVGCVNWRLPALQKAVRTKKLRPLAELVTAGDFYTNQAGLNYAQARYFVMYMQQKGLLKRFYVAFRGRRGRRPVKTIEEVFGKPLKQVEGEFLKWVMTLKWGR